MKISARTVGSVVILDLKGRLTVEDDTQALYDFLGGLSELEVRNIVLNMREVHQLDCSGIGRLVVCFRKARDLGVRLKLTNLRERLRRLLEMARLLTIMEAFDDEEEAIASFPSASTPVRHSITSARNALL